MPNISREGSGWPILLRTRSTLCLFSRPLTWFMHFRPRGFSWREGVGGAVWEVEAEPLHTQLPHIPDVFFRGWSVIPGVRTQESFLALALCLFLSLSLVVFLSLSLGSKCSGFDAFCLSLNLFAPISCSLSLFVPLPAVSCPPYLLSVSLSQVLGLYSVP